MSTKEEIERIYDEIIEKIRKHKLFIKNSVIEIGKRRHLFYIKLQEVGITPEKEDVYCNYYQINCWTKILRHEIPGGEEYYLRFAIPYWVYADKKLSSFVEELWSRVLELEPEQTDNYVAVFSIDKTKEVMKLYDEMFPRLCKAVKKRELEEEIRKAKEKLRKLELE